MVSGLFLLYKADVLLSTDFPKYLQIPAERRPKDSEKDAGKTTKIPRGSLRAGLCSYILSPLICPDKPEFVLLDHKILCFQIAIVSSAFCFETQNTIVRISNTAFVKYCVAFAPNHIFCLLVGQHFHFAF